MFAPIATKPLWRELGRRTLVSLIIFAALFIVLYALEWLFPDLHGKLLQWHDAAFVVGIPASIVGVAYVLTIKNPQNYTGFYGGILMAVLLAVQFLLQGNYDLVVLQLCVFVPFMTKSILSWKKATATSADEASSVFVPQFLGTRALVWTLLSALIIMVADYALITCCIQHNGWVEQILLKLCSGVMIASSTLANFWLIYRKIDAWIWWVVYSASGMVFYILIGNMFSLLLFTVFLLVNGSVLVAWLRLRRQAIS